MSLSQVDSGYESVVAVCPNCGTSNVYNRASDIGHFDPIANHVVCCSRESCRRSFPIGGDLVNPPHELLLFDSCTFLHEKRYIQAVLSATTACEMFFVQFLRVQLVFRPSLRDGDDLDWLNAALARFQEKMSKLSFEHLRCLFLSAAVDDVQPSTRAEADAYVAAFPDPPTRMKRKSLNAVVDDRLRGLLLRVYDASIATLRNRVVHSDGLRPTEPETSAAVTDAYETILRLSRHYDINDDNYHANDL